MEAKVEKVVAGEEEVKKIREIEDMNIKIYLVIATLAAMALLVGAFALPATVSVAYADSNHVKVNQHTKTGTNNFCNNASNCGFSQVAN